MTSQVGVTRHAPVCRSSDISSQPRADTNTNMWGACNEVEDLDMRIYVTCHGAVATEEKLGSKDFNWNCDVDLKQVVRGGWCGTWRRGEVRGLIVCV